MILKGSFVVRTAVGGRISPDVETGFADGSALGGTKGAGEGELETGRDVSGAAVGVVVAGVGDAALSDVIALVLTVLSLTICSNTTKTIIAATVKTRTATAARIHHFRQDERVQQALPLFIFSPGVKSGGRDADSVQEKESFFDAGRSSVRTAFMDAMVLQLERRRYRCTMMLPTIDLFAKLTSILLAYGCGRYELVGT
jgi:hypothetical protein